MADTVRAAVQTAARQIEIREFPRPVIGPDDGALLRIEACGICGSDVEAYKGSMSTRWLPMVPGHEPLGIIEEVSESAAARWGVQPGDRVAVEILIPCRSCDLCLAGRYMSCRNRIGSHGGSNPPERGLGLWGGYSEYIHLHPNSILHKMRNDIPAETAADFERAVRVSSLGCFLSTKHAATAMAERGIKGSIVCISSSNGWSGTAGVIAYAFHKGGINNFVRAAAMDLAPYGIRVNSFTPTAPNPDNPELLAERARAGLPPGGILQGGPRGGLGGPTGDEPWRRPSRWSGQRAPMVPMGTTGTPTDIGHAVAWLCSDYARLITGTDLVVDGGARAKNFAYAPAQPADLAGPLPVIPLDITELDEVDRG